MKRKIVYLTAVAMVLTIVLTSCPRQVLEIPVTGVTLNQSPTATLEINGTLKLTVTIEPEDADNKNVTWTSSNPLVATVVDGLVTAISSGTAIITVTSEDDTSKKATCVVTVSTPVSTITLTPSTSQTLRVGSTLTLVATVLPANATNKDVTWTSSNASVAAVNSTGIVTAITPGSAIITAKSGDKTATCTVTVVPAHIAVLGVMLDRSSHELIIGTTPTVTLKATVLPDNATDPSVAWTSNSPSVATVNYNGVVNAISPGTATITVTSNDDNSKKATCTITVKEQDIPVQSITLTPSSQTLKVGNTLTLTPDIRPANATNKDINWTSSNNAIATVSKGVVTAVNPGIAAINATTQNGQTAVCIITVEPNIIPVTGVTLSPKTYSTVANTDLRLTGTGAIFTTTITPNNATNPIISWSISPSTAVPSLAEIAGNELKVYSAGTLPANITLTVTVSTADGSIRTDNCVVTITAPVPVSSITLTPTQDPLTVYMGNPIKLVPAVLPANATDKDINWTTDTPTVATVSSDGTITPVSPGNAKITATSKSTSSVKVDKNIIVQ